MPSYEQDMLSARGRPGPGQRRSPLALRSFSKTCEECCSTRPPQHRSLHGARQETPNEVPLQREEDEKRQSDRNERRRGEHLPIAAFCAQELDDLTRHDGCLTAGVD